MKCVLVTGATGFIGRQCLDPLLKRGYEVHAATIDEPLARPHGVRWHRANLLDPDQVAGLLAVVHPSHMLHFAWYAVPGKYWTSPENLRWVQASLGLLQAFAEHGGQRVVMAGSCAEYDWRYGYCSEQVTPLAPATLYGTAKHALQTLLHAFAAQAGLSAAWGRIFFLYGPHEYPDRLVASVIRSLLAGEPARCTSGEQIRDYLYVRDVAAAFAALLDNPATGSVNIASGESLHIRDLVYRIAMHLDRRALVQLGSMPTAPGDPPLLVADVQRLHQEIRWEPAYDLETGLSETIAWWVKQGQT